jgi:hypothetical protein
MDEIRQNGSLLLELRPIRKDGSVFSVEVSASFISYGDMEYACAFMRVSRSASGWRTPCA